jgi:hypothetical protein
VAEHFAVDAVDLAKSIFRIGIFPKFSAVVEEYASDQEVTVELGVNWAQDGSGAHHLRDVLDEATAAGVMVFFRGGGAPEAVTHLLEEIGAKPV